MSDSVSARPESVELPAAIREEFAVDAERLEPLRGGYRHRMFRHGDIILRFELAEPDSVHWEHALVRFLAARVPEVPAPLAHRQGVSVWPYVPGSPARRNFEPHAIAAADLLRRLHDAGRSWTGGQRPRARTTSGPGARGPIHGDFHRVNVLMRRGCITGLVDWEESCVDLLEYELANAVWQFCVSKRTNDFDRQLASAMLEAYGSEYEPDDLVPLILARLRYELEVWSAVADDPYRRHLRRSIEKLGG
jgi:Ser/Thr protein kinase RdoA (MazF antagonist)